MAIGGPKAFANREVVIDFGDDGLGDGDQSVFLKLGFLDVEGSEIRMPQRAKSNMARYIAKSFRNRLSFLRILLQRAANS